jgi:hypothetical protein
MKQSLMVAALTVAFSLVAHAENWSGKLLDAVCYDKSDKAVPAACDATSATTMFALNVEGKIYKLDAVGNTKAFNALKNRADRASDPSKPPLKEVTAKVTGTEKNDMIAVETIDVQ